MTLAALLLHCEQRIRFASCSSVADQPTSGASASGLISRTALARHAQQKLTETVVELLDVSEHAHPTEYRAFANSVLLLTYSQTLLRAARPSAAFSGRTK
jgi:hypothetical protein